MKITKTFLLTLLVFLAAGVASFAADNCDPEAALKIYPYPQAACLGEKAPLPEALTIEVRDGADMPADILERYAKTFRDAGVKVGPDADAKLVIMPGKKRHETTFRQEGYGIKITAEPFSITVDAAAEYGFLYALFTIQSILDKDGLHTGTVEDFPRFSYRGVLEGGYSVWGHEQRLDLVKWQGPLKMNTFMYGPKEGHFYRRRWREPFSSDALEQFRQYIEACKRDRVNFILAISPALSMEHANPEEMDRLVAKYKQIMDLGVEDVAIFFDDVLPMLSTPIDRETYEHIAEAEADVTNRLLARLKEISPNIRVAYCPRQYWGWTPTKYIAILREKLDPSVPIGWTGVDIVSKSITTEDAKEFEKVWGRPPAVGDNYSPFGPVDRRSPDLYTASDTYINNPYGYADDNEAQLSKFVDATVGDYSWNPEGYDPTRSMTVASVNLSTGPEMAQKLLFMFAMDGVDVYSALHAEVARAVRLLEKGAAEPEAVRQALEATGCIDRFPRDAVEPMMSWQMQEKEMFKKADKKMQKALAALDKIETGETDAVAELKDALGVK